MLQRSAQREALKALLRRVDEVRSLSSLPPTVPDANADEAELLLTTAEELVDELERSHRRLIETNVQLVSLREVAHSMVSSQGGEETTRTVTSYLLKAFAFREVFLCLADREQGVLEGTWTRGTPDGGAHSMSLRLPLIGDPGILSRAVWQNRTFTIRDPRTNPPFAVSADHPLHEVVSELSSYTVVPLQRSRSPVQPDEVPDACPTGCPFHSGGPSDWIPGPDDATGWEESRDLRRRRCLECNRYPILGVVGVGRAGPGAGLNPAEVTLLESVALSVAPVLENAQLYLDLRKNQRFLDHILNSMNAGLVAVGLDGRILTFNRAAEELTGHQAAYVVGASHEVVFPATARRFVEDTLRSGREMLRHETTIIRPDGGELPVSLSTSLLRNERRQVIGAIATFTDLSRIKVMEERIRQLDRLAALGRFTTSVAHEIRNPLAGIAAGIEYLSKGLADNESQRENLHFIETEIARLDRIIGDLFTVTHPKRLFPQPTLVPELLDRSLHSVQSLLDRKRITLTQAVADGLPAVLLDPDQMQQVLINLIKNAAEASPDGGTVSIKLSTNERARKPGPSDASGAMLYLAVEDEGEGISPQHRQHLFEPFFTTKQGGTGLGLYVSQDIVKRHGGILRVRSENGRGTCFVIELPVETGHGG